MNTSEIRGKSKENPDDMSLSNYETFLEVALTPVIPRPEFVHYLETRLVSSRPPVHASPNMLIVLTAAVLGTTLGLFLGIATARAIRARLNHRQSIEEIR